MKKFVIAGLCVFLLVLVASFPAQVAYNWFAPPNVNLTGISGSVWNGSAAEGLAAGAYFRHLTWQIRPKSLLSGQLAYRMSTQPAGGMVDADVAVSLGGALTLTDLKGTVPLNLVHPAFQQQGITGDALLEFATIVLKGELPLDVDGSVTVSQLIVPNLSSSQLGDYRADLQSSDGTVTASVDDLSGVLDVAGIFTLAPDKSYSLIGEVAARPDAPPSITNQLQFLGSPNDRGLREFRFEGSL